jgi:hypothetical protein
MCVVNFVACSIAEAINQFVDFIRQVIVEHIQLIMKEPKQFSIWATSDVNEQTKSKYDDNDENRRTRDGSKAYRAVLKKYYSHYFSDFLFEYHNVFVDAVLAVRVQLLLSVALPSEHCLLGSP